MPNKFNNKITGGTGAATGQRASGKSTAMPMKTASWPGVPGKTQPKDRSGGVKKANVHVKSEGL